MRKSWAALTALRGSRRGGVGWAVRSLLLRAQLSLGLAPRRCPSPPRKPAGSLHMPDTSCEPRGLEPPQPAFRCRNLSLLLGLASPVSPSACGVGGPRRTGAWRVLLAGTQTADDGSARRPRRAAAGLGLLLQSPGRDPCFNFIQ